MDFDFGYSFGLPSALSPFARLIPTLAGSQYGTFSYTFTDTGKIKHTYATTQTGVEYDLSDGYTVTAGDVFSTPAAVTDILVDDVSVGLGGAAPNDGKIHTVTFIVNSGAAIAFLWQDGVSGAFFVGQYLSFELIDTSTASDIVINNFVFDSGSKTEQFARGSTTDKITLINFATTDWNRYTQQRNIAHDAGVIGEAWVGDNVVVNGRFDTDSDWIKGVGWTISGGKARGNTVTNTNINQPESFVVGTNLLAKMTISGYVSGNIQFSIDGGISNKWNADGTFTAKVTTNGSTGTIFIPADFSSGFNGSIDNVSVQKLLEVS